MLFSTSTDPLGGLSSIATSFFADIKPFVILVLGIALAFFVLDIIIGIITNKKNVDISNNSK